MENNTITPQFSLKTLLYKLPPKLFLITNTILWFAAGLIITPLLMLGSGGLLTLVYCFPGSKLEHFFMVRL